MPRVFLSDQLNSHKLSGSNQTIDGAHVTTFAKLNTDADSRSSLAWEGTANGKYLALDNNLTVGGSLIVSGASHQIDADTLTVKDPLIQLAKDNDSSDLLDIGIYGLYDTSGTDLYSGIFRDATDGKWKLFKDSQEHPTTTVNTAATGYTVGTLVANLEGNATGIAAGAGSIEITSGTTMTLSSGGILAMDTVGPDDINIGIEAAAKTITIGADESAKVDVNALIIELDSAGTIVANSATTTALASGTTFDIQATGNLTMDSSGGTIGIGTDDVNQNINIGTQGDRTINIGTGAFVDTINIGNTTAASGVDLHAGSSSYIKVDGRLAFGVNASSGSTQVYLDQKGTASDSDRSTLMLSNVSSGGFECDGDIIAFTSSDRRLKDNIKSIEDPLEKVKTIGGYTYTWNELGGAHSIHDSGDTDVGVIAQEVEKIIPEAVTDRDTGYKAVQYDKLIPLLVECVKEQQDMIEKLQNDINILKK